MSRLYLIRHGQASFGARDYDVLSDLGAEQARCLGRAWAGSGRPLDGLYAGPRRRHVDTARHFRDGAAAAGVDYPAAQPAPALDEFPAFELLARCAPALVAEDPELQALFSARDRRKKHQLFEKAFQLLMTRWVSGDLDTGDLETYAHFHTRVRQGLRQLIEENGRGRSIALFTSGGPICMALQWSLALPDQTAVEQMWVVGNGSVSEFRYRDKDGITLVRFNEMGHLTDPSLITYR